jgi:phenylalanyl-tRNA synthetase beta chain
MKFTLSWLKEYLDTDATLKEIISALNDTGLEVEGIENMAEALAGFKVAKVREARQHPDADRLRVCDVETEDGMVQVVCGAPNARTGLVGIFAGPGMHIPGTGVDLTTGVIRGVESAGMLCSERELMISEDHDGIIDLKEDVAIGTPAAAALGLDDPVIDIAITPNRPDALGIYGVARDLAAKGLGKLKPLKIDVVEGSFDSPISVTIKLDEEDASACPHFVGRYFKGVKNGPSPDWMQQRLRAIGLRPISALVDITNYVTIAYARPLHVFDAAKVKGDIHIRLAKEGESLAALDGKTYKLDETVTVVADDNGPEALGGIIGGEPSGCNEDTVDVFLEVAYFDPIRTATSGRKLNVMSDARYRFERGIDPTFLHTGVEIATELILGICGGEASKVVEAGQTPDTARSFFLRETRIETLGGIKVAAEEQERILTSLGFGVKRTKDGFECQVPSWRPDINGEADLVEEIGRIVGLDKVPEIALPRIHEIAKPVLTTLQRRMLSSRRMLASSGLHETMTWSFLPEPQAKLFGGGQAELKLANPISSELSDMRPSLIPNLISAVGRNVARGTNDVGLFEVGQVYAGDKPEDETLRAAGVRRGNMTARHWSDKAREVDAYDAKADALAALKAAGAPVQSMQVVQGGPDWFHPGRCGTLQLGPKNQIGWFGEIHPFVLEKMDVKGPLVAFEFILNNIPQGKQKTIARPALKTSDLMAVKRDFAIVVDDSIAADKIEKAARGADKALISAVSIFDVFVGDALGGGKKSVAFEITLQPKEKTLTDEDIEAVCAKVLEKVQKATGGILRG